MADTAQRPSGVVEIDRVIIRFAGDSGDGMQLTGDRFTSASAVFGNALATLPEYPAEIRAPAGTIAGVSAFQVHISDHEITTPGDAPSVLVGGAASLLPNTAWVLRNPQVYVVAIPVLGFVADVVLTMAHGRTRNRSLIQTAIGLFGVMSFGAFLISPSKAGLESAVVVIMGLLAVVLVRS